MALYLGNSGCRKIILDGVAYKLNLYSETPITNGIILLSSDNFMLLDSNGTYITSKEGE